MHVVVESPDFASDAKAAGVSEAEVARIIDHLARRPDAGEVIRGTGGARKVRFRGRGKARAAAFV